MEKSLIYKLKQNGMSGKLLRGCSYRDELARLGRLAHLDEISPSLRNSYKNINVFIREASQPI